MRVSNNVSMDFDAMMNAGDPVAQANAMLLRSAQEDRHLAQSDRRAGAAMREREQQRELGEDHEAAELRLASGIVSGASQIAQGGMSSAAGAVKAAGDDNLSTSLNGAGSGIAGTGTIASAAIGMEEANHTIASKQHAQAATRAQEQMDADREAVQAANTSVQGAMSRIGDSAREQAQLRSQLFAAIRA